MGKKIVKECQVSKNKLSRNPENFSTDDSLCYWTFANIDRSGKFAFDINRKDFNSKFFLAKLIDYSSMTWREIQKQTHDDGRSKHHFLNYGYLSKDALERIKAKKLEEETDSIFSFALTNMTRIIGIRDGAEFKAVWYDPKHEFAVSKLKHT